MLHLKLDNKRIKRAALLIPSLPRLTELATRRPRRAGAVPHFHTLTMPSLDEVTMKPCVVWKVPTSVMMSWCPTGSESGPRRGESSAAPLFCLLWISCTHGKRVSGAGSGGVRGHVRSPAPPPSLR